MTTPHHKLKIVYNRLYTINKGYLLPSLIGLFFIAFSCDVLYGQGKGTDSEQDLHPKQDNKKIISLADAINRTLQNNPLAKNAELKVQATQLQKKSVFDFAGTEVDFHYGQINSSLSDRFFEMNQSLGSVPTYIQKSRIVRSEIKISQSEQQLLVHDMIAQVKTGWFQWIFATQKIHLLEKELLFFEENMVFLFQDTTSMDSITLEKLQLQTRYADIQNRLFQANENYKLVANQMTQLLFTEDNIAPADTVMELYAIEVKTAGPDKFYPLRHMNYFSEICNLKKEEVGLENAKLFPEIYVGYFNQQIDHVGGFNGIAAGLTIPLWFMPQKARIKEAQLLHKISLNELDYQKFSIQKKIENLRINLDQLFVQISFYRQNALIQADLLEKVSLDRYKKHSISYLEFLENIKSTFSIRLEYLERIMLYNTKAVELEYYVN